MVSLVSGAIAFAILSLALGVASERSFRLRDPVYGDREARLRMLEASAMPGAFEVLMLGTSRTGYAFQGRRIEQRLATLGRPVIAFNFGIPASGPITHKLYLDRLLNDGHRPNLIVLEVLPSSLADQDSTGPAEQVFLPGDRLRRAEVDQAIGYGFPEDRVLGKWRQSIFHPWFGLRFQILGRLASGFLPWHLRQDSGRVSDDHGWLDPLASTVTPEKQREALNNARMEYAHALATMTPGGGATKAFEDLLILAKSNGIVVKIIIMPESSEFRTMYRLEVAERVNAFLNEACSRQGVEWIDARLWLEDSAFYDGHHLLRPGSAAFSDRLAAEVIGPLVVMK